MGILPDQFYKTRVLTCPSRKVVELPGLVDYSAIHIQKSLFDWQLYYAKEKYVSCVSEWEARYLKVWLEGGVRKIEVPTEAEVLQEITIELEGLAQRIKKIAEDKLVGYRAPIKREVLQGVWEIKEPTEHNPS